MTSPVDPVEGGAAVEEPVPVDRRRGWTIDTTPLRNPHYRRLFWVIIAGSGSPAPVRRGRG
jgi:hypothetical protein